MTWLQTKGPIATQLCRMQKPGKGGVDGEHSGGQPGRSARETKGSPPGVLSHSTAAVGSSLHHTLPSTDSQPSSPTACRLWNPLARLCPSTSWRADVVCSTTPQRPTASRARPLASGTTYVPLRTSESDPFWVNTRTVTASRMQKDAVVARRDRRIEPGSYHAPPVTDAPAAHTRVISRVPKLEANLRVSYTRPLLVSRAC